MQQGVPPAGGFLELFCTIATAEPRRVFAIVDGATLDFGTLDAGGDAMAWALRDLGARRGDRVAVMLPNGAGALALVFALAKAGLVWVPLNTALVGDALRYILDHAKPRILVADQTLPGAVTLAALEGAARGRFDEGLPDPGDDFAIGYTSGTTGPPKGVRVSHRMLRLAGEGVLLVAEARDGDVMFMWEPLYHIGGAQMVVVPLLRRTVLHLVPRFSASRFWEEVIDAGATHIHYLGGILQILLKQEPSAKERAHGVRVAWGGGAPVEIWAEVRERFGVELRECYGMTEASSFSTANRNGTQGAVGTAMPWFEVTLLGPDGAAVPQGERGEIIVRARDPLALTRGYLNNPEATAKALRDDALHTGDHGSFDTEENLFFHGRMSDSARVRGENVGAWEVESVAAQHPDVSDCAMIGVAADIGEQEIKLFVQPKPGVALDAAAFSAWLEARLGRHQRPRYIAVVEGFERTPSQRIMKHRLSRATDDAWDRKG